MSVQGATEVNFSKESRLWLLVGFVRTIGVNTLGGLIAAFIVGGIGSRIAMRISAAATGPLCPTLITENGNRCGEITLGGTIFLLLFAALFFGILGGLVYAAMRPWLRRLGRWHGLVFGLLLLIIFGSVIIDGGNKDFRLFAQPLVNVALFAVLFPLFGLLIAPLVRWLDQTLLPAPPGLPLHFRTVAVYLLLGAVSLIALYSIVLTGLIFLLGGEGDAFSLYIPALFYYTLLVVPGAYLITKQLRRTPKQSWNAQVSPNLGVIGYSALAVPIIAGLVLTIRSVSQIL
jgi:MFS family permease